VNLVLVSWLEPTGHSPGDGTNTDDDVLSRGFQKLAIISLKRPSDQTGERL